MKAPSSASTPDSGRDASRNGTRPETIILTALLGVLLLAAVGWHFFGKRIVASRPPVPPKPLALTAPLHTARFADGHALVIHGIADAKLLDGDTSYPSGVLGKSSSRSIVSQELIGSVQIHTAGGVLHALEWKCEPANLVLTCLLTDSSGKPFEPKLINWGGDLKENRTSTKGDAPSWDEMLAPGADPSRLPAVMVRLSDGAGGWISGSGPYCADGDPEHRAMLAFSVWPRGGPELEFQAVRPGSPPVSWKLKNPVHPALPAPWTPDPLPFTVNDGVFEMVFTGVSAMKGFPNAFVPQYSIKSKVPGDAGRDDRFKAINCDCREIEGELGTRGHWSAVSRKDGIDHVGFLLPADEKMMRFHFIMRPTEYYPHRRATAFILAKGRFSDDGESAVMDAKFRPGRGLTSAIFKTAQPYIGAHQAFRFEVKFSWPNEAAKMRDDAFLRFNSSSLAGFVGEDAASSGGIRACGGSSSTTDLEITFDWSIAPQPGKEFAIGLVPPIPPRDFFVTVARPPK